MHLSSKRMFGQEFYEIPCINTNRLLQGCLPTVGSAAKKGKYLVILYYILRMEFFLKNTGKNNLYEDDEVRGNKQMQRHMLLLRREVL